MTAQKRPSEQNYLSIRLKTVTRVGGSLNELVRANQEKLKMDLTTAHLY